MKGRHCAIVLAMLFFIAALMSACGREEYVAELGIDDCVYVSERVLRTSDISNLKIAGDYLYYTQNGGNEVARVSLADAFPEEGFPDFSKGNTVLAVSSGKTDMTAEVEEALKEAASALCSASGLNETAGQGEIKFWLSLKSFVIDREQRLYYALQAYVDTGSAIEPAGCVLCSQDGDGQQGYKAFWQEIEDLAVDGDGNVYVLTSEEICTADSEGRKAGVVPRDGYQAAGNVFRQELFGDLEGHVYYSSCSNLERKSFEMTKGKGGSLELKKTEALPGNGYDSYFAMPGGNLLFYAPDSEQILYEYDRESDGARKLLDWVDSGFQSSMVDSVAGVSSEKLLVAYISASRGGLYQLTRTPVEELPEKELLVIASANPDMGLQDAVLEFNRDSSRYRITIESYGAYYSDEENRWMMPGLDPALVSANPPDLVDMKDINISGYAQRDVFEDLYPYLDGSSILSREEFLENMLEGLTFQEKLVCLPSRFEIHVLTGASGKLDALGSWTMEDMYRLTEENSDSEILINTGYGEECARDFYLGSLCARYYLDAFVDWEKGSCCFDNREFGRMLEWVGKHAAKSADRAESNVRTAEEKLALEKNSLLISLDWSGLDLYALERQEIRCGESFRLLGFPVAEGKGYFRASLEDAIGITAGSGKKEGAWEFLEYYLTKEPGDGYHARGFSTSKALLKESFEDALREYSIRYTDSEGVEHEGTEREIKGIVEVGGEFADLYAISQEQADAILEAIETADFTPLSEAEEKIVQIVAEEAESYYNGDKSLEEVTAVIQNRAGLVLKERR